LKTAQDLEDKSSAANTFKRLAELGNIDGK
jgi:hypothetical protein